MIVVPINFYNVQIATLAISVAENPGLSILNRSQQYESQRPANIGFYTDIFGLRPYKVQEFKPAAHAIRRTYIDWVLEESSHVAVILIGHLDRSCDLTSL